MKWRHIIFSFLTAISLSQCKSQQETFGENFLKLQKTIVLPTVKGRIDHLDVDVKNKILYLAALGNNSLEVIDLQNGNWLRSIKGFDEPQGVGYIPDTREVMVANGGNGDCYFFNATNFEKLASIHLSSDADDVRYDSSEHKLYVGYGDGGLAVIDALTRKQIADVPLPAHPEGFQLDKSINKIVVNLPNKNAVGIIDLSQLKLANSWKRSSPTANFPMAIDATHHKVFIGYRHPAKLLEFDIESGKEISSIPMVGDADDVYFEQKSSRVYVSGGGGFINIFEVKGDSMVQLANIRTRSGARTSLLIPALHLFILAARPEGASPAEVMVYVIDH